MHWLDWFVLLGTLLGIVAYGMYATRKQMDAESYLLGNRQMPWWTIGISVMATQASAVTFISVPGKAYQDGLGFIQFYLGMPLAILVVSAVFIPLYYKMQVYTAYEFLEHRFGKWARWYTAFLFLIQRGLAAGITIYAPSIVLSTLLGLNLSLTNICIGLLVIAYTTTGGSRAVAITQKQQMAVMLGGLLVALALLLVYIQKHIPLSQGLELAGMAGKMNAIDWTPDLSNRYTIWSGLLGGFFLSLSYFGTDQSQVGRYLVGKNVREGRLGLLFNGVFKIPMQFLVLFVGVLVFIFFQFNPQPLHFNSVQWSELQKSAAKDSLTVLNNEYQNLNQERQKSIRSWSAGSIPEPEFKESYLNSLESEKKLRESVKVLMKKHLPQEDSNDGDYIFLSFIMGYLPIGLVGLLLAMIFAAAMSSTSGELSALGSVTAMDFLRPMGILPKSDSGQLMANRLATAAWGVVAIFFALIFSLFDNLIEAVNIIGSLFYGTILGIFCTAFFLRFVQGRALLLAGLISEAVVLFLYFDTHILPNHVSGLAYLWLNPIGCLLTMGLAAVFQLYFNLRSSQKF
ncbi:MAG: sodium:solute symporter [Bacteroidetes bacterium]|nr:sodium:solute symporter [Bacteroidota bacterium]